MVPWLSVRVRSEVSEHANRDGRCGSCYGGGRRSGCCRGGIRDVWDGRVADGIVATNQKSKGNRFSV